MGYHNYQIKKMRELDVSPIFALVQTTIQVSYSEVYPTEAVEFFKNYHQIDSILKDAKAGYTVIAESDGKILGTGTLLDTTIKRVFIHPNFQHQGIGKLVAKELIQKAERNLLSILDLSASLASRRFWESMGFIVTKDTFIPVSNDKKLIYYEMVKYLRS